MAVGSKQLENMAKVREKLAKNLELADILAETWGRMIGRIHRFQPSRIHERRVECACLINSEVLLDEDLINWICSIGNYLAVVDLKRLDVIALRIAGVQREDVLSMAGRPAGTSLPPTPDAGSLVTPITVYVEPLMALPYEALKNGVEANPRAINYVVDPQSPVFVPNAEILERLLGIPKDGVAVGILSNVDTALLTMGGAPKVRLKLKALYQHILVVGTTGAGKTTAVKNLIYELVKKHGVSVLAMDSTQEMAQMAFPSRDEEKNGGKSLKRLLYGVDSDSLNVRVILPVTTRLLTREGVKSLEDLALLYLRLVVGPIAELHNMDIEPDIKVDGNRAVHLGLGDVEVTLIPYAFRYELHEGASEEEVTRFCRKLRRLNPFFTQRARDSLPLVVKALMEIVEQTPETMQGLVQELNANYDEIKQMTRIHGETFNNLIVTLSNMARWGLFGVEIGGKTVGEIPMRDCVAEGTLTAVDLSLLEDQMPQSAFLIHMLDRAFWWKRQSRQKGEKTPPLFIVVDEAHNYFPQGGLLRDEVVFYIANKIQRIAREGRKEQLGLILATQFPRDVHSVVRSLCNTRIIFRVDKNDLHVLDLPPEFEGVATMMDDLTAIVKSPVGLRMGYATIRVPSTVTEHVDLSALQ